MKSIKTFLALFLLSSFVGSWALASAQDLLEQDIASKVHTFQKNTSLYSYFNAPLVGNQLHPQLQNKNTRDNWTNWFIALRAGSFWDLNSHPTNYVNAGTGMYLALDPNSSKEFGNSAVILTAPQNAKFISVFRPFALSKATLEALVNESIITRAQLVSGKATLGLNSGFSRFTLQNMLRVENNEFRKLVLEVFKRNNIQFIEYEYKSHLAGFCKVANQSAFVFVGGAPDTVNSQQVLSHMDPAYYGSQLISEYTISNLTQQEEQRIDLVKRFRDALAQIRTYGTGSAKKLISDRLSDSEINTLVDESYECVRRQ